MSAQRIEERRPQLKGAALVLGRQGRLYLPGRGVIAGVAIEEGAHAGAIAETIAAAGAESVLVHAEALDWIGLPAEGPSIGADAWRFVREARTAGFEVSWIGERAPWRLRVRPAVGGRWVSLVLLPYDVEQLAGPWGAAPSAPELARGLARFLYTVGQPWVDGVGRTAERLILSTHPRERGGATLDRSPEVPDPLTDGGLEQPWLWRRELLPGERRAAFVHTFDANAQYLGAWGAAELGFGDPVAGPRAFDPKVPGVWRLAPEWVEQLGAWQLERAALLPAPWTAGRAWFTTPTVLRMCELAGDAPLVVDAYTWPRHSRFLHGAYAVLRDARTQLLDEQTDAAGRLALDAVKALYRVQTGRLNMAARDERSGWHRPDWGHTVRATARVNLHRRLCKLSVAPFAVQTDGLAFATDEADPFAFAEVIGLPLGNALGRFRFAGTLVAKPAELDGMTPARLFREAVR